jgi:SAM-dependent methyltransferase
LSHFRSRGVNISGAEITPAIVSTYRRAGFDVALIESMEQIPFPDGEFDMVYMMQVIEHIARPHEFFTEVRRILRPAGIVYLAMPNSLSIWRRVFGANWVTGWFAPFHLVVYSAAGIRRLARAHRFEVVRSWSTTSDSWLRLNIKAALYPANNHLDSTQRTWLDGLLVRLPLIVFLRLAELTIRERDCLVVELKKC